MHMTGRGPGRGPLLGVQLVLCLPPGPWFKLLAISWEREGSVGRTGRGWVDGARERALAVEPEAWFCSVM